VWGDVLSCLSSCLSCHVCFLLGACSICAQVLLPLQRTDADMKKYIDATAKNKNFGRI
jgi:hypothetical protein